MKNNHTSIHIQQLVPMLIAAFHQAGHAAAIYFGNNQKQLPTVYFQITIKPMGLTGKQSTHFRDEYGEYSASVEGGRLIQSLPYSFAKASQHLTWSQQVEYRCAFEADVFNLLAGPIAVAKCGRPCKVS